MLEWNVGTRLLQFLGPLDFESILKMSSDNRRQLSRVAAGRAGRACGMYAGGPGSNPGAADLCLEPSGRPIFRGTG